MNDGLDGPSPSAAGSTLSSFRYELVLSCCPGAMSISPGLNFIFGLLEITGIRYFNAIFSKSGLRAFSVHKCEFVLVVSVNICSVHGQPCREFFGFEDVLGCIIFIDDYSAQCMTSPAWSVVGPEFC